MTIKTIIQITTGLVLGAGACLLMPQAEAKTVPGNICTTRDTSDVLPYGNVMRALYADGQVLCAMPRDNNTGTLTNAWVRVDHPASAANETVCYLYAKDSLDTAQSSRIAMTSTGGAQSLSFNASLLTTYSYGYYYTACNLKQGGELIGMRYEES